jgi:hypothetical protein
MKSKKHKKPEKIKVSSKERVAPKIPALLCPTKPKKHRKSKDLRLPYFQFRFYCPIAKTYIQEYVYKGRVDELFESDVELLIPEQCTGLKDKTGAYVYEGDIVEFQYKIKPEVMECHDRLPPGLKDLYALNNQKVRATVERDPCFPTNLHLIIEENGKVSKFFTLDWLLASTIVGKRFEEKKKKIKSK